MRLIGVIDLLDGRAVHARRGERERYAPIAGGDAAALASRYVREFGLHEVYVADLDAILGRDAQEPVVAAVCASGVQVWLDAGVTSADQARHAHALGVTHVVIGLETLASFEALDVICGALGGDCVAFSLDLRDGQPIGTAAADQRPQQIASRAAAAGVSSIILVDLARVGSESGPDLETVARVRDAVHEQLLIAGGGVRGVDDLARLAEAGCDGALVATALHTGQLSAAGVEAARHFSVRR